MTIVAAVDRDERDSKAVKQGIALAEAFDEPLHVVHVISQSEFREIEQSSVDRSGKTVPMDEIRERAREEAEKVAAETAEAYEAKGLVGDPADEIIDYADRVEARYICVGGRRRSVVGKALFGSVTQDVLLGTERPVVTTMRDGDDA
ncbi:universal stress protein [Halorubrum vacuolatum]|uniref:Nucleotide-binding universal stress protein, UspA family n=1 Tax=Halorubrum vacuolatum TaxID=63740 RepID=A0A238WJ35_HALVU|nr:universal stress protein [Halorubrum vacuolatum]SNR46244.1 Nucleotide-binding universal stress protein, UspA family [Halorubrum vacuolatum]